jgi:urate oxidase
MKISYGKEAVSVYRTDGRALFAADVRLDLFGETFVPSYTEGDNSMVVATDSMKNFIHARALEYDGSSLEDFLELVGRTFLDKYSHVERVRLRGRELPFERAGEALFRRVGGDYAVAELELDANGIVQHRSGREGLHLVKLSGSAFSEFVRDEYTTLPETRDRPLGIHLNVYWRHSDFRRRVAGDEVLDLLTETFDGFVSESIQHLVHEMGSRLLHRFPELAEVSFEGENRLWDRAVMSPEEGRVKVYTDPRPPVGVIALTLTR